MFNQYINIFNNYIPPGVYSGRDHWIINHTQQDVHFMNKHRSPCRIAQDWTRSWSFATKFCWRTASLMDRNKCGSCVVNHGHKYISRNMSQHVPTAGNMSSTNSSLHGLRHERPSGLCTQCTSAKQTVMARWSKVEKTANYQPFSSHISHSARLSFSDFFRYRIPCSGYLDFFSRQYKPQLAGGHKVVPPGSHRPRFTVDQLNVLRQNLWNPDHPHIPYPRHPHQRPSYFGQKKKISKKILQLPGFFWWFNGATSRTSRSWDAGKFLSNTKMVSWRGEELLHLAAPWDGIYKSDTIQSGDGMCSIRFSKKSLWLCQNSYCMAIEIVDFPI